MADNVIPFRFRDPEHELEQVGLYIKLVPLLHRLDSKSVEIVRDYLNRMINGYTDPATGPTVLTMQREAAKREVSNDDAGA